MASTLIPAYLSPAKAAEYIGASRSFVYRQMAAGTFPSVAMGARRFLRRSDIDAAMEALVSNCPG